MVSDDMTPGDWSDYEQRMESFVSVEEESWLWYVGPSYDLDRIR